MASIFLGCQNLCYHSMAHQIIIIIGYIEEFFENNLAVLFHPNIQRHIISLCEMKPPKVKDEAVELDSCNPF